MFDAYFDELFTNFPTENSRVFLFVLLDFLFYFGGGYPRFGSSDHPGSDGPRFLIPIENLGHTAMADTKLSGNDARTHPGGGHFDDL